MMRALFGMRYLFYSELKDTFIETYNGVDIAYYLCDDNMVDVTDKDLFERIYKDRKDRDAYKSNS